MLLNKSDKTSKTKQIFTALFPFNMRGKNVLISYESWKDEFCFAVLSVISGLAKKVLLSLSLLAT